MSSAERPVTPSDFDRSPNLMAIATFDGVLNEVNAAWERVLGYRADELVGRNLLRLMDDADWPTARRLLGPKAQGRGAIDLSLKHKDGSYRGFEWERRRLPGAEAVFIVGRDVTDRRKLEVSQSLRMYELYAAARRAREKKDKG